MTDNSQQLDELFQKQFERDQAVIEEVGANLKQIFTDEKQFDVVFDMYQQLYKVSNDVQELNHANIHMNAYIDAFHKHLVGEDKLITEEDFRQASSDAYHESIQTIMNAHTEIQGSIQKDE